ncbi:hypothetical protein LGH82_33180 [Mesorhizobium sp. PAMC28654]|uniref:hypothetical protein n=1 Tax=Mesorhizobium sp. PAMC28654 TaxID=2880934 RepID=UPI001D0A2837|nr:hypothetical protein [Mesorhizobium sp. PAMC28654]UDL89835.1 hypothetical protein LGH82_33180 [Mesorhizobium sp. PAMC28654]
MMHAPAPTPLPPAPLPIKTTQDGQATSTAQLAAASAGGFQSLNPTGGMGVPNPITSTAKLLGL